MATLEDYQAALPKAQAANDAEAVQYFTSQINALSKNSAGAGDGAAQASPGGGVTPSAAGGRLQPEGRTKPDSGSFIDPLLQGATLGFSDELAGAGGGLASMLMGEGFGKGYSDIRDTMRERSRSYAERHPWLSTGLELGGGLALPFNAIRMAGRPLAEAVGTGALYGFGTGEGGAEDRLKSTAGGATMGAALYPVGRALSAVGRSLFPPAMPKAFGPHFQQDINTLRQHGIEVTPAESLANPNARQAEAMSGRYFGQSDAITERPNRLYSRLMEMSNFAPEDIRAGELSVPAVQRAANRFSTDYMSVLSNVNVRMPSMQPWITRIRAGFDQLMPFEQQMQANRILDNFQQEISRNRTISGTDYKRIRSNVAKMENQHAKSPMTNYLRPVYSAMKTALDDAFRQAAPARSTRQLQALDRQYGGYKILQEAAQNPDAIGTMVNLARRNRNRIAPGFTDLATAYQNVILRGGHATSGTPEGTIQHAMLPPIPSMARARGAAYSNMVLNARRNIPGLEHAIPPQGTVPFSLSMLGGTPPLNNVPTDLFGPGYTEEPVNGR